MIHVVVVVNLFGIWVCWQAARADPGVQPLGKFVLWDEQVPRPSRRELEYPLGAVDVVVHRADDQYQFLHDNAVVWHNGTLYAAWYNCPQSEMHQASVIRSRRSLDGGTTWSDVEVIAADRQHKGILYVPVAFLSYGGMLYAFVGNMVGPDLVVRCEVFVLDERTEQWCSRGFIAGPLLPNCSPVRMANGNFIMAGRVAGSPATKPETPAVAISHADDLTDPWQVVPLMEGKLHRRFPETTVWLNGRHVTAAVRGGLVFTSADFGRTWSGPYEVNLPMERSKLYAGTLSTGQRYLVWNTPNRTTRGLLTIAVGRPGEERLSAMWKIRDGYASRLKMGPEWSYPCSVEHGGKLYIIYTSQKQHSAMTIVPVRSLSAL